MGRGNVSGVATVGFWIADSGDLMDEGRRAQPDRGRPDRADGGPFVHRPDVVVIGAGSGGLTVAVGLSTFGKRVRLIERAHVGGDCTNVGCIPSKALLHATDQPNGRTAGQIFAHVRAKRDDLEDEEAAEYGSTDKIDLQFGEAAIVEPGVVEVTAADGRVARVETDHIVVATGSSPLRIPIDGVPPERYLTNEEVFELDAAPKRLVIVGAGPVGMEMATAFARMGTAVTVLDAEDQILSSILPEAAAVLRSALEGQGIVLRPGLVAKSYDEATMALTIGPLDGEATDRIEGVDRILVGVGRVPNTDGLGLGALGVELRHGRIVIDNKGRSSVDGVWAAGDVSDRGGTTHLAVAWGRRIVKAILVPFAPAGSEPIAPNVVYADPEVGTIGAQEPSVESHVRRIVFNYTTADRSYTDDVQHAVIIVDVRRFSGKILGATVVGPRAGELISIFSMAMAKGIALHQWSDIVWPYPSYAHALGQIVDEFATERLKNFHKDVPSWLLGRIRRRA